MNRSSSVLASLGVLGGVGIFALLGTQGAPLTPNVYQPVDPNEFAVKWEVVGEVLLTIILLAFLVERALALLFESRWFIEMEKRREAAKQGSYKPLIAFVVSASGCVFWQFDALSIILLRETWTVLGAILTGGVVAGGSKAAVKLFRDVLNVKSNAQEEKDEADKTRKAEEAKPVLPQVVMVPTPVSTAPTPMISTSSPVVVTTPGVDGGINI